MSVLAETYEANGFPALLIILGFLGLLVAVGMLIAGRRPLAGRVALICLGLVVLGIVVENLT